MENHGHISREDLPEDEAVDGWKEGSVKKTSAHAIADRSKDDLSLLQIMDWQCD